MDAPGLSTDQIRQAVEIYVPERLETFDALTGVPLPSPTGAPMQWDDEMRMTLLLFMWGAYDESRPN